MINNPFNITKAVDYTDEELYDYWVDFPINNGFSTIIKPTSEMPMIILGSKGSGKTHIMKHFSFTMQSLRWQENLIAGIQEDGYLGIYLRCSGLNGYRFNGKNETEEIWQSIFSYYLELWLSQLLLDNIITLKSKTTLVLNEDELVNEVLQLFDIVSIPNVNNLIELSEYINSLQKKIDYSINNRSFSTNNISDDVKILISAGKLIFGLPEILRKHVEAFKTIKFLYLLDEYENFTGNQQRYFNTLIRERKEPTCFKIGARRYGIRTYQTLSAGEEIKRGSEFEEFDLDEVFRNDEKSYKKFIKGICEKRIQGSLKIEDFHNKFDTANDVQFLTDISKENQSKVLKKLENKLKRGHGDSDLKIILKNLSYPANILIEKTNLLLFYRSWRKGESLVEASKNIRTSCVNYINNSKDKNNKHSKALDKHKRDLLDQIYREYSLKIPTYAGFDNIIKISNGIPRHFLIIMKHIFRWNEFKNVDIFKNTETSISVEIQLEAILDAANWFIEDSKYPGENGERIKDVILRLCDYLRELRFSDIPPESAISTFSIKSKVIPKEISEILEFLKKYSYIIELNSGRRDRNTNHRSSTYQINGLLASKWELSLNRRGIVDLSLNDVKTIFCPSDDNEYTSFMQKEKSRHNAPFKQKNQQQVLNLF